MNAPVSSLTEWDRVALGFAELDRDVFLDLLDDCYEADRNEFLRMRFRWRQGEWARWAQPQTFTGPFNRFDWSIFGRQKRRWQERKKDIRRAMAAPRGISKSTNTKADARHDVLYGIENFLAIVSAESSLAEQFGIDVRDWFADLPPHVEAVYGRHRTRGGQKNFEVERPESALRYTGTLKTFFAQRGLTGALRGLNVDGIRPSRVVLDDPEDEKRVFSKKQRGDWQRTVNDVVLKLGDPKLGTLTDWLGTTLHTDAILMRIARHAENNRGWRFKRWAAVIEWPDRADLWKEAEAIYMNLDLGDEEEREALLLGFLDDHPEAFEGADVLAPERRPLHRVYIAAWEQGWRSVHRELQNDPDAAGGGLFTSKDFKRFKLSADLETVIRHDGTKVRIDAMKLKAQWDPAMGDDTGDFPAIALVGQDSKTWRYVIHVWAKKQGVSKQIAACWSLHDTFGIRRIRLESNAFQGVLKEMFEASKKERAAEDLSTDLAIIPKASTENKDWRISTIEGDAASGRLSFNEDLPQETWIQFDAFPAGDNDDIPDAVHGACEQHAKPKARRGKSPLRTR